MSEESTGVSGGDQGSSSTDSAVSSGVGESSGVLQSSGGAEGQVAGAGEGGSVHQSEVPQQYQPNWKFNVMDNEHEVDEWLRPLVKAEADEKKLKDILSKAYGLDFVKPKYESTKQELGQVKQQFSQVAQELQQVGKYLQNGDLNSFFKQFKLTDEQVLQYAIERLSYYELPPEQRQNMDKQLQERQRLYALEQENAQYKQQTQQQSLQDMNSRLNQTIEHPQVKTAASEFDRKAGKPGAFRDAVIRHAVAEYQITGKDLQPHEAVGSFLQLYGYGAQPSQVAANQQAQPAAAPQAARPQALPKVGNSNGMTPVKRQAKNLDDLRKMRDTMSQDEF